MVKIVKGSKLKMVKKILNFFFTTFSEPLGRADSKKSHSLFLGPGHLRGPRVSLGRILGGPSIGPFFQRAVLTPPPPVESPPTATR